MITTKVLDWQSFSKVWKSAVWQTFCANSAVSKIWPHNIICRPLREHILFTYLTNFTQTLRKIYIGYLELRLKMCENVKSVIVWNVSFCLAFRSFKNTGPNSTILNQSKPVFWRSSSLKNCNNYVALINMKHSTESKTKTGFNRTIISWHNTFLLRTNVNGL